MDRYSRNKVMRLDDERSEAAQCGRVKEGRRDQKVRPKERQARRRRRGWTVWAVVAGNGTSCERGSNEGKPQDTV